ANRLPYRSALGVSLLLLGSVRLLLASALYRQATRTCATILPAALGATVTLGDGPAAHMAGTEGLPTATAPSRNRVRAAGIVTAVRWPARWRGIGPRR